MSIDEAIAAGEVTEEQLRAALAIQAMMTSVMALHGCPLSDGDVDSLNLIRDAVDRLLVAHRFPIIKKAV